MKKISVIFVIFFSVVLRLSGAAFDDLYNYEYSYGDYNVQYDHQIPRTLSRPVASPERLQSESHLADRDFAASSRGLTGEELPLCCPEGQVYNVYDNCSAPPSGWHWKPFLSGEPSAEFAYHGFPHCKGTKPISLYQKEIFFNDREAFIPRYIQMQSVPPTKYCVSKVYDNAEPEECELHQTKVFICVEERDPDQGMYWTAVAIAHLLLLLTLIAFFCVRDLRCLQGQYMICFLISLLLYNICLLPGSVIKLQISFVSCVSLGAVKYFFFCGVMLWFNVMCFDIWRTLKNCQDVGTRKRFLLYSIYTWVIGALLTTVVLVIPYVGGRSKDPSLMEDVGDLCKLKTDINMILQLVETLLMVVNLVFLSLATSHICKYTKFGNGLPRCEASLCLKQGWKLYIIMIGHTLIDVPDDILDIRVVDLWRYVLIESLAIFAVFAYRKSVLRALYQCFNRNPCCYRPEEEMGVPEKHQLTTVH